MNCFKDSHLSKVDSNLMRQYVSYTISLGVFMFAYIFLQLDFAVFARSHVLLVAYDWFVPNMCMQVILDSFFKRMNPLQTDRYQLPVDTLYKP